MNTLGQNMKALRKELGMSQKQLADLLHTSQQYISKLEKGSVNMSAEFLISAIYALETTFEIITDGVDPTR